MTMISRGMEISIDGGVEDMVRGLSPGSFYFILVIMRSLL